MEERPKIVKICGTFENSSDSSALSYMTVRWEVGGRNTRQANCHQLPPALLQSLLSFLARLVLLNYKYSKFYFRCSLVVCNVIFLFLTFSFSRII